MSDYTKVLEITGTKDEAELYKYIENQKANIERMETTLADNKSKLEAVELDLDSTKKERTTAKAQATKSENKLVALKEEKLSLVESNKDLVTELGNQSTEIQELKAKLNQGKKNLPTHKELVDKAKIIMKQEKTDKVFVSLYAQVFLNENQCQNACGSKYKVATLVDDDKVQLSSPL